MWEKSVLHFHELSRIFKTIFLFQKFFSLFMAYWVAPSPKFDVYLQFILKKNGYRYLPTVPTCGLAKNMILIFSAKPYTKSNPYHPTTPGGIIAWEKYKIIFHAKILTICFMRIVITILKSNYKYVHRYIIVVLTHTLWMFMC